MVVDEEERESEREKGKLSSCFPFFFSFFSDERDWRVDRRGAANFGTPFDNTGGNANRP